jgi:hypothetical protein
MTAKRGTQWKTSWRRQKSGIGSGPVDVWFFNRFSDFNGGSSYRQPAAVPTVGDAGPPYWVGSLTAIGLFLPSLPNPLLGIPASAGAFAGDWALEVTGLFVPPAQPPVTPASQSLGVKVDTTNGLGQYQPLPLLSNDETIIRAVVALMQVEPLPSGSYQRTLWVDGNPRLTRISASYVPNPNFAEFCPQDYRSFMNGWAGGNASLTDAEIRQWFADVRLQAQIVSIPGKTSDLFTAAPPTVGVPPVLVNQAGGQNATLIAVGAPPVPFNIQVPAWFGY